MKEIEPLKNSNWSINEVPLVSISCITYNHSKFIKDTLDGFLMQRTSFPMEILIHDDASTDGTQEIIREYAAKYPAIIKPIYQTENQWSKGRKGDKVFNYPRAKGKYIAHCEGDDYWIDPLKVQKQVDFLEQNPEYGVVYTNINKVNKENHIIERNSISDLEPSELESFEHFLIQAPFLAPCTWVFRKNLIKERAKNYVVGDLPLLLDIVAESKIYKLPDITANYRVLPQSASHFTSIRQHYAFMKGIYELQMDYAQKYRVNQETIDEINLYHAYKSYNFAVAENDRDQIRTANRILKGHPLVTPKFKLKQLMSKFKAGRKFVRMRMMNTLLQQQQELKL